MQVRSALMGLGADERAFVDRLVREVEGPLRRWRDVARLRACLQLWVRHALRRCHDRRFAEQFARLCPVRGTEPRDYLQRVLPVPGGGRVLAGIRFKGGDVSQPFVDLIAWDRPLDRGGFWPAVLETLGRALACFEPRHVRVLLPAKRSPPVAGAGAVQDLIWFAAPLSRLQAQRALAGAASFAVERTDSLAFVPHYREAMAAFRASAGALGEEVTPTSADGFQHCIDTGAVVVARRAGRFAGVAAAARDRAYALDGFVVHEMFLDAKVRGRGLGPVLQRQLIAALDSSSDPLLYGTIHAQNAPSLATARRLGREQVASWWFVELPWS